MFYLEVDADLKLALQTQKYSKEIFETIDRNREHLKEWLVWVDNVKSVKDVDEFARGSLVKLSEQKGLNLVILYKNKVAGITGFNEINMSVGSAVIGYWLAKEYNGKGIMIRSVKKLIEFGFDEMDLKKIEIDAVTDNKKSRAIPEKIGFKHEGTMRHHQKLNDGRIVDHSLYGLLKSEYI